MVSLRINVLFSEKEMMDTAGALTEVLEYANGERADSLLAVKERLVGHLSETGRIETEEL